MAEVNCDKGQLKIEKLQSGITIKGIKMFDTDLKIFIFKTFRALRLRSSSVTKILQNVDEIH